jgi:hypothetical protein
LSTGEASESPENVRQNSEEGKGVSPVHLVSKSPYEDRVRRGTHILWEDALTISNPWL